MFLIVKIDNKFDESSEIMTVLSQAKGEVCMKTLLSPAISYVLYDRLKEYRGVFLSVCGPVWGYPRDTVFSRSGEAAARNSGGRD